MAEGGDGGLTMTPDQLEAQYVIKASQYDEFRKYFNQGWTIEQLGKHFGASYNAVKSCARRLELSFSSRRFQRTLRHLEQKAKKQEAKAADQERLQQLKAVKRRLKKQLEERPQAAHQLRQVYRDMASLTPRPGTKARRPPKMTATEYSAFRAEVARRSNKSRGLSEGLQQQALNLYFEEGLTAKQVADRLGTTKGSIRGAVNRAYDRMTPEEHSKLKTHHGSVVRTGARNSNYRGTL